MQFNNRNIRNSIDWSIIICYLILIFIGWINIYASVNGSDSSELFDFSLRSGKQLVWILSSLGLAGIILFIINANLWESLSLPLYIGICILLVAVIFLGVEVKGSHSWFKFGPIKFQPAEISKIATSLLIATIMSQSNFRMKKIKHFIIVALSIILPILFILGEKETGSALVYCGFAFVLYREGFSGWFLATILCLIIIFIATLTTSSYTAILILLSILVIVNCLFSKKTFRNILIYGTILTFFAFLPQGREKIMFIKPIYILLLCSLFSIPFYLYYAFRKKKTFMAMSVGAFLLGLFVIFSTEIVFNKVLQEHQRKRIEVLLGLKEDPNGVGYNVRQSMIAIGSGGLTGKGFMKGTQTTYGFVPEQSTDFIFCTIGEEWGFIGCFVVISLFVFLMYRILLAAERSRSAFTRIYGYCVCSCLFMHLFINIGMTIGLMPVIGIPLPFISYGGSSLWAFTILLFIFIALDRQEKRYFN